MSTLTRVSTRKIFSAEMQFDFMGWRRLLVDLQLKDKVVLITGGGKGIGEAITRGCAREGAIPVFVDKDSDAGKKLHNELVVAGSTCSLICADVLSVENCRAAVDQTLKEYGRLDVLANNVGANDNGGLENGSPAKYVR